jgi:NDP-sugar pyrophosphorylase family protein
MSGLIGVIPAAGRGVRAYPYTAAIPKAMLEVDGVPLIQRNVELMRDQLGIRDVRIVVGHQGHVIREWFGDGSDLGVRITYVTNDRLDLDLAYSVHVGTRGVADYCCVILGDECYVGSNHAHILASPYRSALATCGLIAAPYAKHVRKNYTVTLADGRIVDLQEKPTVVVGHLMGTGTYVLSPELVRRLSDAFSTDPERGPRIWTSWLANFCGGETVLPFLLTGSYVNVNSRDDLNYANFLARDLSFEQKQTSVVYVIDQEEAAAVRPIEAFAAHPEVDEVVAVARRSSPALEAAAGNPKVRLVVATRADLEVAPLFKLGLNVAKGARLLLAYSDDTFSPRDVSKLLVYMRDADMVIGTRTTRQMIEQGANMRGTVRTAHLILAKLLEILWWRFECRLTDVCCVYRGIWRSTYDSIRENLTATGAEFLPEMIIEVLRARRRVIEIPVNYYNRDLEFTYVRSRYQTIDMFQRIVAMMIQKRWGRPVARLDPGKVVARRAAT